jgi:hypothetical protein
MLINLEVIRGDKKDVYPFVGPSFNHILSVIDKRDNSRIFDSGPFQRLH